MRAEQRVRDGPPLSKRGGRRQEQERRRPDGVREASWASLNMAAPRLNRTLKPNLWVGEHLK